MVTVITRTIGPSGRDYASFTLAEADVENIGTSADLVANDEAIVFEADAGTYSETVNFTSTLVTDATRKVTYKPAAGAEHGGVNGAGALLLCSSAMFFNDDFTEFQGIEVKLSGSTGNCFDVNAVAIFNGCILSGIVQRPGSTTTTTRTTVANCLFTDCVTAINIFNYGDSYVDVANCTLVNNQALGICRFIILGATSGNTCEVTLTNILSFGTNNYSVSSSAGTVTVTGGGCFYSLYQPFPAATLGSPNPITASTAYDPGAGDFALYVGKNGALLDSPNNDVIDGGVGPSVNSDVPTTDILGNPRSGATANPGAFEVPQATATLTRTIGPVGRDYASFTLAEADVTNIGGSADLVNENERIVFEADAATYANFVVDSTLVTDATRNVTYKAAAGSEHGGDVGSGARLIFANTANGGIWCRDDYTRFIGLVVTTGSGAVGNRGLLQFSASGLFVDACLLEVAHSAPNCIWANGASTANIYQNNLLRNPNYYPIRLDATTSPTSHKFVSNTIDGHGNRAIFYQVLGSNMTVEAVNNFIFNVSNWAFGNSSGGATFTTTGSNNVIDVVGSNMGSGVAVLECTATTSFSTPLASGDYAVYMGSNASLANVAGNDAWGIGVGPSVNSDVPTTDINGVARSGATCNPGAFEADGFVAPTVLTRTIGSGKDYASFTLAEADVENIGGSADLTFENEAIVFEADAGTYAESVTLSSTLTSDATRNVTYKPAAGSEHNGDQSLGVIVQFNGNPFIVLDGFTVVDGLNLKSTFGSGYAVHVRANGAVARSCLLTTPWAGAFIYRAGTSTYPCVVENCVMYGDVHGVLALEDRAGLETYGRIVNCTSIGHSSRALQLNSTNATGTLNIECHNWLVLGSQAQIATGAGTTNLTGSGSNFGSSFNPWPVALQGSPYPITATTSFSTPLGSGDYAVYMGATGALADVEGNDVWQHGIGPALNSDVPTTDINGVERSGTRCNPGAFEADGFVAPTVLTRTIGSGKDYASFTLAEADVENIGGSADLTFENEAIVFEADAATYTESVTFQSTLTTDATRQVTYKPAAGSEHGGNPDAGVIVTSATYTLSVFDDFTHVEGLVAKATSSSYAHRVIFTGIGSDRLGLQFRGCVIEASENANGYGLVDYRTSGGASAHGTADHPMLVQNCVFRNIGVHGVSLGSFGTNYINDHWVITNCTFILKAGVISYCVSIFDNPGSLNLTITNCLNLSPDVGRNYDTNQSGWVQTTVDSSASSNNFGASSSANFQFPGKGSPYPVTPTTNTSPGAGDWAIYEAATGALVYDSDNDVLGQGIGPAGNSAVPTTDILGNTRSGASCDPGAFEASPAIAKSPGGTLVGGYVPVGTYDVVPDSFPEAVEEAIPLYSSTSQALYAIRPIVSSETKAGNISTRTWTLQYRNASRSEYSRVLELYALSKGGAEGLYWNNQNFTRGGSTETVVVRMSQGPLKATRSTHGRYKFTVKLEEMRYAP
jgi:hypothetical protein